MEKVMSKPADYKCKQCGTIREIYVEDTNSFPEEIPCYNCEGMSIRLWSPLYSITHQGKAGNSKNGYTSNPNKIKKS